jgi:aspartate/methionine/tyrosine aminotransferase
VFDEFYSRFLYTEEPGIAVSAAEFVDDVEKDPVIVIDGLTKNWRYPGWRLSWTVGPSKVIEAIASAGSFLDGGANHPIQGQALELLNPHTAAQECVAIQTHFKQKRDFVVDQLKSLGFTIASEPQGAFYIWADLSELPPPFRGGIDFFRAGLEHRVITVPGVFFDVNPGRRRPHSRFDNVCRISFGPPWGSWNVVWKP